MANKAVIAIDVDDVLLPLNERVARIAGIRYDKITTFYALDNQGLNESERMRLYEAYRTPGMHAGMDPYPDAGAFACLARDPRAQAWIVSNSLDQDVVQDKQKALSKCFGPDWDAFRTMFHVINMAESKSKKFPEGLWLLVDDSPLNAIASHTRHVLMPKRPWNTSEWAERTMRPIKEKIIYYTDIKEACATALTLLDRDFGPLP